jgi:hypothetical protein
MLVYSAGSVEVPRMVRLADQSGQNNFLFTFAGGESGGSQRCARHFCKESHRNLVIDSGAFSVWNSGQEKISVEEYIDFCRKLIETAECPLTFVSLDVIAGSKKDGLIPTPEQSEMACKEGWKNYMRMRAAGISAIPTFHEFDDPEWLFLYLNETDHIAVSPRKRGVSQELKLEWLGSVFVETGLDTKVHGLGIAGSEAMESFPFYSVDSSAWLQCSKGNFRYFDGRRTRSLTPDDWRKSSGEHFWDDGADACEEARREYREPGPGGNFHFMMRALNADKRLQNFVTSLWSRRGVYSNQTPKLGTSYYLELSDRLYSEAATLGNTRLVAERRRLDLTDVEWAVNLARETAHWQAYQRGEIPLESLADRLGWKMWNEQLSLRELYLPRALAPAPKS